MGYGDHEITLNSVFLLLFGIYAFLVSTFNFIRAHKSWKIGKPRWKGQLTFTYLCTFAFALSLAFLTIFAAYESYNYANYPERYTVMGADAFRPQDFITSLVVVSPAFLFPIGLVLLILGFAGLPHRRARPKSYLITTLLTSVLFTLGGAGPALLVLSWWVGGGISMC